MRTGRLRPMAGVLLVVTMLVGGFWMPASAEDALLADATPTVTEAPVVTPEVTVEPPAPPTEEPTEATTETPVVTEEPVVTEVPPVETPVATETPLAAETPSPTATTPAKAAPAKVAPLAVGEATVTVTVTTSDGAPFPADAQICVWESVNWTQCGEQGVASATFTVAAGEINYWIYADGYQFVDEYVEVADGATVTFDAVLQALPPLFTSITNAVSDPNPAPGSQVTFTVRAWGSAPYGFANVMSQVPWGMTAVTMTCNVAAGSLVWPESCDAIDLEGVGTYEIGLDTEEDGSFDVTITVTGTLPDEPGYTTVNVACVNADRLEMAVAGRDPADPIAGEECAMVTLTTQSEQVIDSTLTVNVSVSDGSPVPAGTTTCISNSMSFLIPNCVIAGASATFAVPAGAVQYAVFAPGYATGGGDVEIGEGEDVVVEVVLEPATDFGLAITKTVSDPNPMPGEQVSYEIHISGSVDAPVVQLMEFVPNELTNARVSCEVTVGWAESFPCALPVDGLVLGMIGTGEGEAGLGAIDAVITLTGTVPNEAGVTFTNTACVGALGGESDPEMGIVPAVCAAATLTTQEPPAPEAGTWGAAAMSVDVSEAMPGDPVTYTLTLPWTAAEQGRTGVRAFQAAPAPSFVITDPVPQALTNVAWTCVAENATCSPDLGSGYDVTAEGSVIDPARDALVTITITGNVADDAVAGDVVNEACVNHDAAPSPMRGFMQMACVQAPQAVFVVLAQPVDPTVTPAPTDPATPSPTATPDPAQPTATVTATPAVTPAVSGLPSTGTAPGGGSTSFVLFALAAAVLAVAAVATRGERVRR